MTWFWVCAESCIDGVRSECRWKSLPSEKPEMVNKCLQCGGRVFMVGKSKVWG